MVPAKRDARIAGWLYTSRHHELAGTACKSSRPSRLGREAKIMTVGSEGARSY